MHRSTVAALVTAAVIGVAGGTAAATVRGHDASGDRATTTTRSTTSPSTSGSPRPSSSSSPSVTPSATAEPAEPLLYFSPGRIHDGTRTVRVAGVDRVQALTRTAYGYLVVTAGKGNVLEVSTVTPRGVVRRVAGVVGTWDIDTDRARLVGLDAATEQLTVWNLDSRRSVAMWDQGGARTGNAVFAGKDVLVVGPGEQATVRLYRWNPATNRTTDVGEGNARMGGSPGGSYLSSSVGTSGGPSDDPTCLRMTSTFLKHNPIAWTTCSWEPLQEVGEFSPDGTRLLAVPAKGGGDAGPARLGVFDATDGPDRLVGDFGSPAGTLGAQWADDDHLYLYGSPSGDPGAKDGTWIKRCDLRGACRELVRSKESLTVGYVT